MTFNGSNYSRPEKKDGGPSFEGRDQNSHRSRPVAQADTAQRPSQFRGDVPDSKRFFGLA
jgi:hypothetical protein